MRIVLDRPQEAGKQSRLTIVNERMRILPTVSEEKSLPDEFANVKRWTAVADFSYDEKKANVIKDGNQVVDIQNVTIEGYLSTFKETTPFDRQGDYVQRGAFKETLDRFRKNPVMLKDHTNLCENLVGKFIQIEEDSKGLKFVGQLSNAPDVQSVRFKVFEGMLQACSMGGFFHYEADGHGIFKVELFEGSLIPIPANPDARYVVRALNELEKSFAKCMHRVTWYDFLKSQTKG